MVFSSFSQRFQFTLPPRFAIVELKSWKYSMRILIFIYQTQLLFEKKKVVSGHSLYLIKIYEIRKNTSDVFLEWSISLGV